MAKLKQAAEKEAEKPQAETPAKTKTTVSEKTDNAEFDYKNLTGEQFRKYAAIVGEKSITTFNQETGEETTGVVGSMKEEEMADFSLYKVDVVMKPRFPGVKDTPYDFNGVKIKSDTPEHTTRIPVKTALEINKQILNAHSRAGHGKYYLLTIKK